MLIRALKYNSSRNTEFVNEKVVVWSLNSADVLALNVLATRLREKRKLLVVLGRARKNRVWTSASLLASESMTRPSQARARAQFLTK
jgi:hypothetical protein